MYNNFFSSTPLNNFKGLNFNDTKNIISTELFKIKRIS